MLHSKSLNITSKKIALFPGSFNKFHLGHLNVLLKANQLFDEVIIFIAQNPNKSPQDFSSTYQNVCNYLKQYNLSNKIVYGNDLTIEIAEKYKCQYIVRGIRDTADLKYEIQLANEYKKNNYKIEVVFIVSDNEYTNIRSSSSKLF